MELQLALAVVFRASPYPELLGLSPDELAQMVMRQILDARLIAERISEKRAAEARAAKREYL